MKILPRAIRNLIDKFSRLPGIGPKSAGRIVFYLLTKHIQDLEALSQGIKDIKKEIIICSVCQNFAEEDPCGICRDSTRDQSSICIVERPLDIIALEKAGFEGVYHVLGGVISPIDGIGPEDLNISSLVERIRNNSDKIKEIILATNPSLEGEATAVYISEQLRPVKIKTTRLARGLPVGGDLEYADELTLSRSLEGRKEI